MLKPLAIAVMGLAISVLLSLLATPIVYYVLSMIFLARRWRRQRRSCRRSRVNGPLKRLPATGRVSSEEGKPATT